MKDWQGKNYDYIILSLGNLIVIQRWSDYKKWTEFPDGKWCTSEIFKAIERYESPQYKFFWWWLRFANFIKGTFGILKALGQGLAIIRIPLQILGIKKVLGICNVIIEISLQISGNVKIQSASCVTEYVSWQHFGTWQDWANTTGGKWYYMC